MHPSPRLARRRATTLMATALAVLPAAGAHAADSERDVSAGAEIDLQSRAIARGVVASEGPAVQPSGWLGVRGATASVWSSFDPQGHAEARGKPTDLTVTLAYDASFGPLAVTPSVTAVTFPGLADSPTTLEAALDAALDFGPAGICVNQSADALAFAGAYFVAAGLCAEHDLGEVAAISADVTAGAGNRRFHEANFGLAVPGGVDLVEANLRVTLPMGEGTFLRAHGTLSRVVHPDLLRALPEPTLAVAGAAVGVEI